MNTTPGWSRRLYLYRNIQYLFLSLSLCLVQVYSVATDTVIQNLIGQYKRRKLHSAMPSTHVQFARQHRPSLPTSSKVPRKEPVDEAIDRQQQSSNMKVGHHQGTFLFGQGWGGGGGGGGTLMCEELSNVPIDRQQQSSNMKVGLCQGTFLFGQGGRGGGGHSGV